MNRFNKEVQSCFAARDRNLLMTTLRIQTNEVLRIMFHPVIVSLEMVHEVLPAGQGYHTQLTKGRVGYIQGFHFSHSPDVCTLLQVLRSYAEFEMEDIYVDGVELLAARNTTKFFS